MIRRVVKKRLSVNRKFFLRAKKYFSSFYMSKVIAVTDEKCAKGTMTILANIFTLSETGKKNITKYLGKENLDKGDGTCLLF